jgi:mRNA deadenylase 3'-5' endonuclease subunit Ccr4
MERLLFREFRRVGTGHQLFTVLQWNVLADQLAIDFPTVTEKALHWDHRRVLIEAELTRANADLIFLQEIDHYKDFIEPFLATRGYHGFFQKKDGWHYDGLCILYRDSMFDLVSHSSLRYGETAQLALIAELIYKPLSLRVIAVTTHLRSYRQCEAVRLEQIKQLISHLELTSPSGKLVMGMDMNSEPSGPVYAQLLGSSLGLTSLYREADEEPEFTTHKYREALQSRTIDYLFARGFSPVTLYSLPTKEAIGSSALPSEEYPSDHLALSAGLTLD